MLKTAIVTALALGAALPAAAQAHVTLQPNTATAGAYTRLDVRVPNEKDNESTNKIEVGALTGGLRRADPAELPRGNASRHGRRPTARNRRS